MLEIIYKIFDFVVIVLLGYCFGLVSILLYSPDILIQYVFVLVCILIGLVVLLGVLSTIGNYLMFKKKV
jgi:uncharacterized membrane protein YcaP (DUF421 family)